MDPNETLSLIRELVAELLGEEPVEDLIDSADMLAKHFQALDNWLKAGGFLPAAWQQAGESRGTILGMPIEPIEVDEDEDYQHDNLEFEEDQPDNEGD